MRRIRGGFFVAALMFAIVAIVIGNMAVSLKGWVDSHLDGGLTRAVVAMSFTVVYVVVLAFLYKVTLARYVRREEVPPEE